MEDQLSKLLEKENYAIDKVIQHSPEIVEGYLRYKTIGYIIYPIIFLLLVFLTVFVGRKFGDKEEDDFMNDVNFFGRFFGVGGFLLWSLFIILCGIALAQLLVSIDGLILLNTSKEMFIIENLLRSR